MIILVLSICEATFAKQTGTAGTAKEVKKEKREGRPGQRTILEIIEILKIELKEKLVPALYPQTHTIVGSYWND